MVFLVLAIVFRFARFGCFGGFVSVVSLVSLVSFRFVVSGFSTCPFLQLSSINLHVKNYIASFHRMHLSTLLTFFPWLYVS